MDWADTRLVDVGVDYFTSTATTVAESTLLLIKGENLAMTEARSGFFMRPWSMMGYSGWACGRVQYGQREDGAICRISGGLAASSWWNLWEITPRCSRIDLQVTLKVQLSPTEAVSRMRDAASSFYADRHDGPKVTMWSDSSGGATLYLGSRQSALYFRAYNKEAESKLPEYEGCVRLELEVKNRLTKSVIAQMLKGSSVRQGILSIIGSYMVVHGIPSNLTSDLPCSLYEHSPLAPDCLKSLEWLRVAVQPTVRRLLALGYGEEVFKNLGLS